jgi:hypothetical protein
MTQALGSSIDEVARGVNESRKISRLEDPHRLKLKQFEPSFDDRIGALALSTFYLGDLATNDQWALLDSSVRPSAVAYAALERALVQSAGLQLDPDWDPERHVNLIGWPADEVERRDAQHVLFRGHRLITR